MNGTSHVPAFLTKLWRIVDDESTNDLICWNDNGKSFIIRNPSKFARELLPLYYKHNNMASFVRQLNMYGFHKIISVEQGGLKLDREEMEFAHPFFIQGNEDALEFIKRKIPTAKLEDVKGRPDSLNKVLIDVRQMKGKQEAMDSKLVAVKRENEALWRELAQLRQKHVRQQQIVSKLIQFLVSMMSSQSPRISFKRRMPLMLNDVDEISKPNKITRTTHVTSNEPEILNDNSNGPVIHEVFETEVPSPSQTKSEPSPSLAKSVPSPSQTKPVPSPHEKSELLPPLPSPQLIPAELQPQQSLAPAPSQEVAVPVMIHPETFGGHVEEVQEGLDTLKDLLQGGTYNIDVNTLNGVGSPSNLIVNNYNNDAFISKLFRASENDLPLFEITKDDENKSNEKLPDVSINTEGVVDGTDRGGSDLMPYNPCLFELADDDSHFFENDADLFLNDELDMMLTTERNKLQDTGLSA